MKKISLLLLALTAGLLVFTFADAALAQDGSTAAQPWQMTFQSSASTTADRLHSFHKMVSWIASAIAVFVFALLAIVILRFNKRANPVARQFSHNTTLEVLWTAVPVIILVILAIPSMRTLYYLDRTADPEMTIKVTGYQWYWGYEYPDNGGFSFMSYMIPDDEIDVSKGQKRLLSVDNPLVLPIDTNIQILVTPNDVLLAFAMPALGLKLDAIPGHVNETWVRITKPGVYYGQCSELCGKNHAYMPIEVHAVTKTEYAAWVATAQEEFAGLSYGNNQLALARLKD